MVFNFFYYDKKFSLNKIKQNYEEFIEDLKKEMKEQTPKTLQEQISKTSRPNFIIFFYARDTAKLFEMTSENFLYFIKNQKNFHDAFILKDLSTIDKVEKKTLEILDDLKNQKNIMKNFISELRKDIKIRQIRYIKIKEKGDIKENIRANLENYNFYFEFLSQSTKQENNKSKRPDNTNYNPILPESDLGTDSETDSVLPLESITQRIYDVPDIDLQIMKLEKEFGVLEIYTREHIIQCYQKAEGDYEKLKKYLFCF